MRLYSKMGDSTKLVRVDNWGIFFLQRLQMFFSKTDYCDMTLQFEGNVQLKVHRLVMNACTEYFQFLEQTCSLEDNVIMMPSDLQADVIVPIVNFMYTGMLEFHLSIFDRLYKTAQVMNITILTKLLDAQKQPGTPTPKTIKKKAPDSPIFNLQAKKAISRPSPHSDLPAPLPGRKLPVWKRKSIPTPSQSHSHNSSPLCFNEPKWTPSDPLLVPDNAPKPTRFEWPEDDLPPLPLMETSFEEISYTSKPLLTQEEEHRASTSFDDLKQIPNANRTPSSSKKNTSGLDMEEMKNYVKEQKIRSGLSHDDDDIESGKRKGSELKKTQVKKVRFDEHDNKTTISIATEGKTGELNHEKIVAEILKKYPQLVKKNKNIRLKIMAKNKTVLEPTKTEIVKPKLKMQVTEVQKSPKSPWKCDRCSTEEEPLEFVLYYLYRKHMTDVHNEKFDSKLCKYCGHKCNKQNLLMYHLYTKHGLKPPPNQNFPICDLCPFIALSPQILTKHKLRHNKNEIQCIECKLTFTSEVTLTSHIQITGHTGKSNKNNYDCQYCTKRFQSVINLFAHVRLQHKHEGIRDGIVSVDEIDDFEDYEEEDSKDEYILPEIITDSNETKKVNILSNVKVQERHETHQLTLEPSSEAEALNNVATGIATSLGLVDIVVINDSQQLFENFDQSEQPEFILPELTTNQNEGVITQSMLGGDIGSTDELVMVLTDHDYGDNQEEINNDNSNIVVLYSHPVDGQQDQFITSQGNLMVNSQTGLFEIRNGAITSTPSQVVTSQETESIEMIQREIESHRDVKPEPVIETEKEHVLPPNDALIESLTQGSELEFTSPPLEKSVEEENEEKVSDLEKKDVSTEEQEDESQPVVEEKEEATTSVSISEEIEEEVEKEEGTQDVPERETEEPEKEVESFPVDEVVEKEVENFPVDEVVEKEESSQDVPIAMETEEPPAKEKEKTSQVAPSAAETEEPPPVEEKEETSQDVASTVETEETPDVPSTTETEETEKEEALQDAPSAMEIAEETPQNVMEIEEETPQNVMEIEEEKAQSDVSTTSQFNDENSQSSQESQNKDLSTKIAILDDWEDTDSQQSDNKEKEKVAEETVHKLMDDWEEEDEEEKKDTDG